MAGLIMVVGAQNIYVFRYGLLKQHLWLIILTCWLSDVFLTGLGIFSMAQILQDNIKWMALLSFAGFIFLGLYGCAAFSSALRGKSFNIEPHHGHSSRLHVWGVLLAITYLNPHVYLDTVLLVGSIGATHPYPENLSFLIGTALASLLWFSSIGFGARLLLPFFRKKKSWQYLDLVSAFIMWGIACNLIWPYLFQADIQEKLLQAVFL